MVMPFHKKITHEINAITYFLFLLSNLKGKNYLRIHRSSALPFRLETGACRGLFLLGAVRNLPWAIGK